MRKLLIFLRLIACLIIPAGFIMTYANSAINYKIHRRNSISSPFTYKNETNKTVGFENVKIKQFDFFNPKTQKYEYYLNDYGKKYLVKRFMETAIIGPEISGLKAITFSDSKVIKDSLGVYYSIAKMIFINPFPFLKQKKYGLWEDSNQKLLQEKRVEMILPTLIHEYSHYLFNSYASSPIGYITPTLDLSQVVTKIKRTNNAERKESLWNRYFYDQFKSLFYKSSPPVNAKARISDFLNKLKLWVNDKLRNAQNLREKYYYTNFKREIAIYMNGQKIYDRYRDVKDLFELANENKGFFSQEEKKATYLVGGDFDVRVPKDSNKLRLPILYKIEAIGLFYLYSVSEQVVRKLLLSIFKPSGKFPIIDREFLTDDFYTSMHGPKFTNNSPSSSIANLETDYRYRFFSDNIFPTQSQMIGQNRSRLLVEKIIDYMMGHHNHSELSFISTKNGWEVFSQKNAFRIADTNYNQIKLGGFIDDKEYNYVGYKSNFSDSSMFEKFPIKIRKFNIWYKNSFMDQIGQRPMSWRGENREYYWHTKGFLDKKKLIGKNLYFLKVKNGKILEKGGIKKIKTMRKNDYGIVNSFDQWLTQDKSFVERVMQSIGSGPRWLVIGDKDTSGGVYLSYYYNQEAVENIWGKRDENTRIAGY